MFMTMIWILAITSAAFELFVAYKLPAYLRFVEKFPLFALIASITLSWFLGKAFGAAGLIALMGGLLSTLITLACYLVLARWHSGEIPRAIEKFRGDWQSAKQLAQDLWKVIYFCIRVVTFPIWGYRAIRDWFSTQKARLVRS